MTTQLAMYRSAQRLARWLPGPVSAALASALGGFVGRLPDTDGRKAVVASHMARVYSGHLTPGETSAAVSRVYSYYARYWAESLRLPSVPVERVLRGVTTEGECYVDAALALGKGLVIAPPHLGGWEWGARYLVARGIKVTVAVEALEPRDVFDWFVGYRRSLGVNVVPVGPGAGPAILQALEDNHVVCLLADRVVGTSRGVDVEFFGAKTRLPAGPVTVAARSGAQLVPAAIYFGTGCDDHHIVFRPPLALPSGVKLRETVATVTRELAAELEVLVRMAPEQWHLLQPNWPDDAPLRGKRLGAP